MAGNMPMMATYTHGPSQNGHMMQGGIIMQPNGASMPANNAGGFIDLGN